MQWRLTDWEKDIRLAPWDVILCRNLVIYLTPEAANGYWKELAHVLKPHGCLVTGKTERPSAETGLARLSRYVYARVPLSLQALRRSRAAGQRRQTA